MQGAVLGFIVTATLIPPGVVLIRPDVYYGGEGRDRFNLDNWFSKASRRHLPVAPADQLKDKQDQNMERILRSGPKPVADGRGNLGTINVNSFDVNRLLNMLTNVDPRDVQVNYRNSDMVGSTVTKVKVGNKQKTIKKGLSSNDDPELRNILGWMMMLNVD